MSTSWPDPDQIIAALEQVAQSGEPAPGTARLLDVGTEHFVNYFEEEVLNGLIVGGGATVRVFEGSYGTGKTHLLDLLHDLGVRRRMAVVRTTLSDALSLSDWRLVTQHVMQNIELTANGETARSLPRVLDMLARSGPVDASALTTGALPHPGVARGMELLANGKNLGSEGRQLVHRFLLGERVTVSDLRKAGATGVRNPLSTRNAEPVLKTALSGLIRLSVPGTMLLFDENEHTFSFQRGTPPKKVVAGANLLRRLIDASATGGLTGCVAVFAVLPGFIQQCALAYPALGQRLHVPSGEVKAGWRWPVLRLDLVGSMSEPRTFLAEIVKRFEQLASHCGMSSNDLEHRLTSAADLCGSRGSKKPRGLRLSATADKATRDNCRSGSMRNAWKLM
jgi:hypothetical protein